MTEVNINNLPVNENCSDLSDWALIVLELVEFVYQSKLFPMTISERYKTGQVRVGPLSVQGFRSNTRQTPAIMLRSIYYSLKCVAY